MIADAKRASLYDWHLPDEMLVIVDSLHNDLGRQALLRPGTEYREAFVAARFAKHRSSERVRLLRAGSRPTPDFSVLLDEAEHWFETTEADRPGRKRDLEYSEENHFDGFENIPDEHWVEPDAYLAVIQERCAQKAAKGYDKCDGLIIWSNAFPISNWDHLDENWWKLAAAPAQGAFPEVWRHFQSKFSRIY
jgi:hypothetical protein